MAYLLRRRGVGRKSCTGIASFSNFRVSISPLRDDVCIRWGCTTPCSSAQIFNSSEAIHKVYQKGAFRILMRENEVSIPSTWSLAEFPAVPFDFSTPKIVRPPTHAYGRNLFRVSTQEEYIHAAQMCPGGYVSEFIPKMAEYRVMVVSGRVIAVIRKTHADGAAVAWNRHSGGQFRQIKPEHWRMWTVREAVKAFKLSGLDFGAVDVIIDNESRPYILEINSAPAVRPWMQERWSKAFDFMLNHPEHLETTGRDYRAYMHPTL